MFLANKRTLINHRILLLDLTTSAGLGASAVAINRDERVVVDVFLGLINSASPLNRTTKLTSGNET